MPRLITDSLWLCFTEHSQREAMPENYTGKNEKSKGIQAADAAPASFILPVFVVVGDNTVVEDVDVDLNNMDI